MKPVSVSYAKNNLSALLRRVREGQTVTITDRGVPVATLGAPPSMAGVPPRFIEMAERGLLKLPDREPTAEWTKRKLPRPKGPLKNNAVDALIEERRTGR
ncbi:MAG TPA: type II toxin-antitoxin system prevent-host-death family antitoxin [Gemmatimonadaceae bacterium]